MAKRTGGFIGQDGINAPDQATGVSGSAGDTEVTVSFTAPSDVGGAAITGYNVQANDGTGLPAPNISLASYANKSLDTSSQGINPMWIARNNDGTKFYTLENNADTVFQYNLSTAFDLSTGSYASVSFSVSSQDSEPVSVAFNDDGTKMYIGGSANNSVFQYTLSSAFNPSTASYASKSFSPSSQGSSFMGALFNDDGTSLYISLNSNDTIFQYTCSTAYDVSTASYASKSLDYSSLETGGSGFNFNSYGTQLFLTGRTTDKVYQYDLSTAYDLSSASLNSNSFSVVTQDNQPKHLVFSADDTKFYLLGQVADDIFQYNSGIVFSYPTASPVTMTGLTNGTSYTFNVWAINPFGWSSPSDATESVTPAVPQRGLIAGSYNGTILNTINFIEIPTTGNATDFGDMTSARYQLSSLSNVTRGVFVGGDDTNVMDYVTIASAGNAVDFGDLIGTRRGGSQGSINNTTRGVYGGGWANPGVSNVIQYLTFASTGNMTSFGTIAGSYTGYQPASCSSSTRGIFAGADSGGNNDQISYITISSAGNTTDFGNLYNRFDGASGSGNATRGIFAQGYYGSSINVIQYITIASTGNATEFGACSNSSRLSSGSSNATRSVINEGAASSPYASNTMGYITIGTTGNTSDFGDLTYSAGQATACSSSNGGTQ